MAGKWALYLSREGVRIYGGRSTNQDSMIKKSQDAIASWDKLKLLTDAEKGRGVIDWVNKYSASPKDTKLKQIKKILTKICPAFLETLRQQIAQRKRKANGTPGTVPAVKMINTDPDASPGAIIFHKEKSKWLAIMDIRGIYFWLGHFTLRHEARTAYKQAAKKWNAISSLPLRNQLAAITNWMKKETHVGHMSRHTQLVTIENFKQIGRRVAKRLGQGLYPNNTQAGLGPWIDSSKGAGPSEELKPVRTSSTPTETKINGDHHMQALLQAAGLRAHHSGRTGRQLLIDMQSNHEFNGKGYPHLVEIARDSPNDARQVWTLTRVVSTNLEEISVKLETIEGQELEFKHGNFSAIHVEPNPQLFITNYFVPDDASMSAYKVLTPEAIRGERAQQIIGAYLTSGNVVTKDNLFKVVSIETRFDPMEEPRYCIAMQGGSCWWVTAKQLLSYQFRTDVVDWQQVKKQRGQVRKRVQWPQNCTKKQRSTNGRKKKYIIT